MNQPAEPSQISPDTPPAVNRVQSPQGRCRAGFARADITPPVGIYHRMWGAALHDRSTGVHRPLTATALWLEPADGISAGQPAQLLIGIDHCLLDLAETEHIRSQTAAIAGIDPLDVHLCLSHTHGSAWMSRDRSTLPGGDLIGPYLDRLTEVCGELAREAQGQSQPVTLVAGQGICGLARHRDYFDPAIGRYACGFNPTGESDQTLLVIRVVNGAGVTVGTLVNYACHPTTLAWQNTLISPDYVGALRALIEDETGGPCLFVQGASGNLGPKEGYVGDPQVADRNGRQVGYAALSILESLPPAGTEFVYTGAVVSGAVLGTWAHQPLTGQGREALAEWNWRRITVPLPYRAGLPTKQETEQDRVRWLSEQAKAEQAGDEDRVRECRARSEQMTRQLARLNSLPDGAAYPYRFSAGRCGSILFVLLPGELYQLFQTELRRRFPDQAILIGTIVGDWQPGYLPTAETYGLGIYQEQIAMVAPGALELVLSQSIHTIEQLLSATR